jgi:hypothetical protein
MSLDHLPVPRSAAVVGSCSLWWGSGPGETLGRQRWPHDDAAALQGGGDVYSPFLNLLVSGENPKLRLGRRRSSTVPSMEAPLGDAGSVVELQQWMVGSW